MRSLSIALFVLLTGVIPSTTTAEDYELKIPLGLKRMRIPRDNPLSKTKIELGKQLYFDGRLSRDNTVSCASCHDPNKGWSNGARFATGIRGQVGGRSAPTIINAGYSYFQFWDGRAQHVEGQALGPIQNPIEMDLTLDELVEKLNKIEGYRKQFRQVFGTDVTSAGIAKAIGAFERTVLSGNAPYDRFKAGDQAALSPAAKRGRRVFFNRAHCSACHSGGNFSDGGFHNLGVGINAKNPDLGRYNETKLLGDRGAFKTPTLRGVSRTAPYMHDGSIKTLRQVVEFYNKGGERNGNLDPLMQPLKLSDRELGFLVEFLKALDGDWPARAPARSN